MTQQLDEEDREVLRWIREFIEACTEAGRALGLIDRLLAIPDESTRTRWRRVREACPSCHVGAGELCLGVAECTVTEDGKAIL